MNLIITQQTADIKNLNIRKEKKEMVLSLTTPKQLDLVDDGMDAGSAGDE